MPFQKFFLFPAAIFLLFTACSLKYESSSNAENTVPEIISEGAVFSSVEDEKKLFSVKTEKMEQYQGSSQSCSKKLDFEFFNKDGILQAQGRCDFLYADENTGEYFYIFKTLKYLYLWKHQNRADRQRNHNFFRKLEVERAVSASVRPEK